MQPAEPAQRGEPPDLLPPGRHRVVARGRRSRSDAGATRRLADRATADVRMRGQPVVAVAQRPSATASPGGEVLGCRMAELTAQPTAPSICSSISRLSSSAYSIGSSRAIGSTKPRTIMAIASSSVSPRLMR